MRLPCVIGELCDPDGQPALPLLTRVIAIYDGGMGVQFRIHGIGQFDSSHGIGPCVWPHFDLLTVLSGRVWVELLGDRVELTRGQAILIHPQTPFVGGSDAKSTAAV